MAHATRALKPVLRAAAAACGALAILGSADAAPAAKGPVVVLSKAVRKDGFTGGLDDCGRAVLVRGSTTYVAGYESGTSNGRNAAVFRFDGKLAWQSAYGHDGGSGADDEFHALVANKAGEFYAVGYGSRPGAAKDAFVQKYMKKLQGASGNVLVDAIGGDDAAHDVALGADGTLFAVGEMTVPRAPTHVWLGKFDADAAYLTQRTYSGPLGRGTTARAAAFGSGEKLFVAGAVPRAGTGDDLWIARFDTDMNLEKEVYVAGDGDADDVARDLVVDRKGRVWVAGSVAVAGQGMDVWLGGFDSELQPIGTVTRSGPTTGDDAAHALAVDAKGHVFLAGRVAHANGGFVPWVGVFDTHLAFVTETTYETAETTAVGRSDDHDGAHGIALLPGNVLMVTGGVTDAAGNGDVWLARYVAKRLPKVKNP